MLELAERDTESETETEKRAAAEELTVAEAVIKPASCVKGRTAATLELRRHWEINLLALSRQGRPIDGRARDVRFEAGDVLLLEGDAKDLTEAMGSLGVLPPANRKLKLEPRSLFVPVSLLSAPLDSPPFC